MEKGIEDLLLSKNQDDVRLGFEIAKRSGVTPYELSEWETSFLSGIRADEYKDLPVYGIILDYLEVAEDGIEKQDYIVTFDKWQNRDESE